MADDTPDTPPVNDTPPAPRRRAAPRKTATRKPKGAVTQAASAVKDAVVDAEQRVVRAVKPRAGGRTAGRSTSRTAAAKAGTARGAKATADKPAKTTRKASAGRGKDKSTLTKATDAVGGRWGAAAIGGLIASGVTAAVLTLRGSSGKGVGTEKKPIDVSGSGDKGKGHPQTVHTDGSHQPGQTGAHQADGSDSSASFQAGIADEGSIPNKG